MSAPSTLAFFGLRFKIDDDNDIETLEERNHLHQRYAKQASLDHYWANFDESGELYYSFIGKRIGVVGLENDTEIALTFSDLERIQRETQQKLSSLGFEMQPQLYLQMMSDA
ncbi:MAG: hypothetical protein JSR62_15510 [Nitrospira sp.]|nr:hypothetical protein [Nitrospira sp.]